MMWRREWDINKKRVRNRGGKLAGFVAELG
jgi:hypothetical protein